MAAVTRVMEQMYSQLGIGIDRLILGKGEFEEGANLSDRGSAAYAHAGQCDRKRTIRRLLGCCKTMGSKKEWREVRGRGSGVCRSLQQWSPSLSPCRSYGGGNLGSWLLEPVQPGNHSPCSLRLFAAGQLTQERPSR